VEYGWVNEPPIAGQPNAIVINITPNGGAAGAEVDASGLKVQAIFGGQTKVLGLQPLGENTPGQFIAPMTPTRPGKYAIHLGGNVGSTVFDADVAPEEVRTADVVQFPVESTGAAAPALGIAGWLGVAGFILAAVAMVLAMIALSRKPAQG